MIWVWCDGEWSAEECARVSWADRGWTHGLGLFETLLAVDGRAVWADRHLDRLARSCEAWGWTPDLARPREAMGPLLVRNGLSHGRARIRLAVSGGVGGLREVGSPERQMVWMKATVAEVVPDTLAVGISRWKRNGLSPLAGHKSASYAENLFLLQEATRCGWDEALVFNHAERLCESATANVFLVRDGALLTPALSAGCLPGVTRGVVLELAGEMGIRCVEAELTEADLLTADEVFLTSATRGVVPVCRIGGRNQRMGPLAHRLAEAWWVRTSGAAGGAHSSGV